MSTTDRGTWPFRRLVWIDIAWGVFAVLNLIGMLVFAEWETVPFHFIWVSITVLYGFRVWRMGPTLTVLGMIIVVTAVTLAIDISRHEQPLDEITEVPLMAAMFLAMVWHAQRRLTAMRGMERVSQANLRLLADQRRFIQDASHELRTPIAVASGHAELIERKTRDSVLAADAAVVTQELMRLRQLADRLLLLAAAEDPEFLHRVQTEVEPILVDVLRRWGTTPRQWRLGSQDEAVVDADADRLAVALDALVENAVKHTGPKDWIELGVRGENGLVTISVADSGSGIPESEFERIFERFARADGSRWRRDGGVGLGLAIVKTIVEAHGGTVGVSSTPGKGSVFELRLRPSGVPA